MNKFNIVKEEQHVCPKCKKNFAFNSSLIKHIRIHTGERPYLCNEEGCYQQFSQVSNLIRHKRIHLGLRPYSCQICKKSFSTSCNLKQHLNIHKNKNRQTFICFIDKCKKSYLYKCTLKKHIISSHKYHYNIMIKNFPDHNFYGIISYLKLNPNYFHFINFKDEQDSIYNNTKKEFHCNSKKNLNNSSNQTEKQLVSFLHDKYCELKKILDEKIHSFMFINKEFLNVLNILKCQRYEPPKMI